MMKFSKPEELSMPLENDRVGRAHPTKLNNILAIASCGVDRISIGAITHSAIAVDIGLDR
jgi:hypothetical protein